MFVQTDSVLSGFGDSEEELAKQIAGDQGKKVAGLGKGVMPGGVVFAVSHIATVDKVAVGKEHRAGGFVTDDGAGEHRHHIGPIRKAGDGAEPLCLALGAIIA